MPVPSPQKLAAVRFNRKDEIGPVLQTVIDHVRKQGTRISGYLQREISDDASCCSQTYLEAIASGEKVRISQPLGNGSRGCRLDPHALTEVSGKVLAELDNEPELLVVNRFGRGEADGHGFRSAIEKAFTMGIPVLTAVNDEYLEDWRAFGEDYAAELPARSEDVLAWCDQAIVSRSPA